MRPGLLALSACLLLVAPRTPVSAQTGAAAVACTTAAPGTARVRPSLQLERFADEPDRFARGLRAALRRAEPGLQRASRADVAEVRVEREGRCAIVLTPDATARHARWLRAVESTGMRGAIVVRVAGARRALSIDASPATASGVLPFQCDDVSLSALCASPPGALATRTLGELGASVEAPTDWIWRASPTGFVASAADGAPLLIRIARHEAPSDHETMLVLETGARYARAREGDQVIVTVALPLRGGDTIVCTASEAHRIARDADADHGLDHPGVADRSRNSGPQRCSINAAAPALRGDRQSPSGERSKRQTLASKSTWK